MPRSRAESVFSLPRWSEADARVVLDALERSGEPVAAFAAAHGVDAQRLYVWRRRLGASAEHTSFREVVIAEPAPRTASFEVVLPTGVTVRVGPSFDSAALARLLEVLSRVAAC
jgi:transposase-like protein